MIRGSLGLKISERKGVIKALKSRALGFLQAQTGGYATRKDIASLRFSLLGSELFDSRWKERQACDCNTKQGFQNGYNGNPRDVIGVVIKV